MPKVEEVVHIGEMAVEVLITKFANITVKCPITDRHVTWDDCQNCNLDFYDGKCVGQIAVKRILGRKIAEVIDGEN